MSHASRETASSAVEGSTSEASVTGLATAKKMDQTSSPGYGGIARRSARGIRRPASVSLWWKKGLV
eukprot:5929962-Amphidinium_carterae.1